MKSNKLTKCAHARVVSKRLVRVFADALAHRFERSLPEQPINKRARRRMIKNEPVVARQGHAELVEVGEVGQAIA